MKNIIRNYYIRDLEVKLDVFIFHAFFEKRKNRRGWMMDGMEIFWIFLFEGGREVNLLSCHAMWLKGRGEVKWRLVL